ncbi:MAG: trypsin-like peptidase domain-containing protein [Candidatus Udaeobacter sp.]
MNNASQRRTARGLLLAVALSGWAAFVNESAALTPSEKMMWSTYAIGTAKGMAACVIVNRKDPAARHGIVPVLVTAAHVLAVAPHGPYYIAIRTPRPGGNPDLAILEFAPGSFGKTAYTQLPYHDVAALELRIPDAMADLIALPSFIDEDAIAQFGDEWHVGDAVSVLGFPKVFPGTVGGFGILRGGTIASYSPGGPRDREKFLINANVYSGDSGGPVFAAARGGRPKLVGLLIERIGQKTGEVPLAVAVDATVIRETLQALSQPDRRSSENARGAPGFPSNDHTGSTVKLAGPPSMFIKVVRTKRPAALPIPFSKAFLRIDN